MHQSSAAHLADPLGLGACEPKGTQGTEIEAPSKGIKYFRNNSTHSPRGRNQPYRHRVLLGH